MESIDINFVESGNGLLYCHRESSFVPRKNDFLELHGRKYIVGRVKWVIHEEDGIYVMVYLNPLS